MWGCACACECAPVLVGARAGVCLYSLACVLARVCVHVGVFDAAARALFCVLRIHPCARALCAQNADGSFCGDAWGEVDSRFSFCALACMALVRHVEAVRVADAVDFLVRCRNFDGGFGRMPGSESHAGQVFCCVGALAIAGALHHVDADLLGWWLCERQLPSGACVCTGVIVGSL